MTKRASRRVSDFFPLETPRPHQVRIMDWMEDNWDKKFFLIDAPPGVGKSAIAMAAALKAGRAYLLTSTKALQDQYMDTFEHVANLKGKDNYDCGINPLFRVSHAPCIADKDLVRLCKDADRCPYYRARDEALLSQHMITSYAYMLSAAECGPLKDHSDAALIRDAMVCDEAHELDSIIAGFLGFTIDPTQMLDEFGLDLRSHVSDLSRALSDEAAKREIVGMMRDSMFEMCERYEQSIARILARAKETAGGSYAAMNPSAARQTREIIQKRDRLDRIMKRAERYSGGRGSESEWLVTPRDGRMIFSPLVGRVGFEYYLSHYARKVVLMSASLGSASQMCAELGIPKSDMASISVGTPFDPANSPIFVMPVAKMDRKNIDSNIPKLVRAIDDIMTVYPDKKGIIHTSNYRIASAIMEGVSEVNRARLIGKKAGDRVSNEDLLDRHSEDPGPTVLLSPSMHTGVDLRGDLSRFQIMAKLPWPSLDDPRIVKKSEDFGWYTNEMVKRLVQASGRSTRDEDDHSDTYLLDEGFVRLWKRSASMLPLWFRERVKVVDV